MSIEEGLRRLGTPKWHRRWGMTMMVVVSLSSGLMPRLALGEPRPQPQPSPAVLSAEKARIAAIEKATRSTIGVFGLDGQGGGSGVIISSDGYALTNFHVTEPFGNRMRCGLSNGEMVEAVIVGIDPTGDLALIKLYGTTPFPAATIGDSNQVQAGQWCFAAGNPFVLATNLQPTVTWGIVSGVHRYQYPSGTILEYTDCIQTDAAINPGNSGGPLYNDQGDLIGINGRCSFEKRGRVNVGVGYAISIHQAMLFLGHLKSGRIVDHATLGFTVSSDSGRVKVSNILESSDAYRRGIRYDDEILQLDGRPITSVNQLKNILGIYPSHSRLRLQYRHQGEVKDTWIRVTPLHMAEELDEIARGKPVEGPPQADAKEKATAEEDPLADRFESRRGFANYHFNRLELDRVRPPASDSGEAKWDMQVLECQGKLLGESTTLRWRSTSAVIESKIGEQSEKIDRHRGWNELVSKKSLHGYALGLRLWREWTTLGPRKMGEAIYLGTTRMIHDERLVDLTQVTTGEVESYFYTDPADGRILLIELESDREFDRLEVYFEAYHATAESPATAPQPARLRVGYGPEEVWMAELEPMVIVE